MRLGALRDDFSVYAESGFDDAVVMVFPGGPGLDKIRALV